MMEGGRNHAHGEVWFGLLRSGKRSSMMEGGRNHMARFCLAYPDKCSVSTVAKEEKQPNCLIERGGSHMARFDLAYPD
jgi:hypothetical protein